MSNRIKSQKDFLFLITVMYILAVILTFGGCVKASTKNAVQPVTGVIATESLAVVVSPIVEQTVPADSIVEIWKLGKLPQVVQITVKYPTSQTLSGVVYVSVTIDRNGRQSDIKVYRKSALGPSFEKEAIDAVKMAKFTPGRLKGGQAVASVLVLPIKFIKH